MYILGFVHTGIQVFEQFCNVACELHRQVSPAHHLTTTTVVNTSGLLEQNIPQANELSDVCHTHNLKMK